MLSGCFTSEKKINPDHGLDKVTGENVFLDLFHNVHQVINPSIYEADVEMVPREMFRNYRPGL
jgi:hypothetical protein